MAEIVDDGTVLRSFTVEDIDESEMQMELWSPKDNDMLTHVRDAEDKAVYLTVTPNREVLLPNHHLLGRIDTDSHDHWRFRASREHAGDHDFSTTGDRQYPIFDLIVNVFKLYWAQLKKELRCS